MPADLIPENGHSVVHIPLLCTAVKRAAAAAAAADDRKPVRNSDI